MTVLFFSAFQFCSVSRHEQEISTLKKTLDTREHDVVELSRRADRLQQVVTYQKKERAKLQVELSSAQELSQKLKFVEAELKASC